MDKNRNAGWIFNRNLINKECKILGHIKAKKFIGLNIMICCKEFPKQDWICLATSSKDKPNFIDFENFVRTSCLNGVLEFKGHGTYSELLHDLFDEMIV